MNITVGVGIAASFITALLASGTAQAAMIHLQSIRRDRRSRPRLPIRWQD